jgi:drug/metabolite transporter (DMT)-like permease
MESMPERPMPQSASEPGPAAARPVLPSAIDYGLLLMLGATWGASFLMIKVAVATIPPLTVAVGRILVGAAALGAVVAARGARLPASPPVWRKLAIMGSLGTVLPFALISWGETRIDSGLAAILMSAVPVATMVLAHFLQPDEPITWGKVATLVCGAAGVVVLVGPEALAGARGPVMGQLAVLGATVCYAYSSILARRLAAYPPDVTATCVLAAAAVAGVPLSLAIDRPWQIAPSPLSLAAVIGLGLVSTAGGYLLLYRIIASAGVGFASINNYLVPLFGVFWGVTLLGERPNPRALVALLLVFAGIAAPRLAAHLARKRRSSYPPPPTGSAPPHSRMRL